MKPISVQPRRLALSRIVIVAAALLSACGGGVEDDHGDKAVFIDTTGRIATTEINAPALRIHDLDSGSVEASYALDNVPNALYASPGGRYAVAVQRTQDQVQFIDGGIWQEDHGSHLHDYKARSMSVAWKLPGARPTHYDVQHGSQAAFFMDGNASATPVQNAAVRVITDASIAAGNTVASLDLSFPIHGVGEPVGNKLITVSRAADALDTLPTHLHLYLRSGSGFSHVRQLPTRCDGMHGSYSSGSFTIAGCVDGMLAVRHLDATTVSEQKISTASRVSTVAGHPRLPGRFIGIGSEGAAPGPVTTRFYAIDAAAGTAAAFVPQGWDTGHLRRAHGFDRSGQRFFVIDNQGTLIVSQQQGGNWTNLVRTAGSIPVMPSASPWPAITANGARDELYITDPVARQLVVVNSVTGAIVARRDLGFAPSNAVWLGIAR